MEKHGTLKKGSQAEVRRASRVFVAELFVAYPSREEA